MVINLKLQPSLKPKPVHTCTPFPLTSTPPVQYTWMESNSENMGHTASMTQHMLCMDLWIIVGGMACWHGVRHNTDNVGAQKHKAGWAFGAAELWEGYSMPSMCKLASTCGHEVLVCVHLFQELVGVSAHLQTCTHLLGIAFQAQAVNAEALVLKPPNKGL